MGEEVIKTYSIDGEDVQKVFDFIEEKVLIKSKCSNCKRDIPKPSIDKERCEELRCILDGIVKKVYDIGRKSK